ncbi:unnamed protein product [Orchesella dallaii]|uniref:F-box domain-containing protein n=1 Tax=Orchesella dallaii TaxID=48710 RepID=A0ABP1S5A7_9HEXA
MGSISEENKFCFLCYKPTSCVNPNQNRNCPENFVPLLFRHLNIINTRSQNLVNEFQCCDDCSVLSKSFCDFFLQLESIQLQLTWKVRRIYETMFDAATDPFRFNKFRQSFFGVEDDDEGVRRQLFNEIQMTRKNLMKKCKEVWKSKEPRVQLESIFKEEEIPNQTEVEVKREIRSPEEMRMISPVEATVLNHCPQLATFFSYLVVLHLSLPIDILSSPHSHCQNEELLEPKIELMELRKKKRTINDIPSKLLDHLLSYLNDPKDLFNCRLVQNSWKDSMSRVLEEKVLSNSSKWNLLEFNASEPLIPNLWLDLRECGAGTFQQRIFCPPSLLRHPDNPFPTKSLQFGTTIQDGKSLYLEGREIGNVDRLFAKFGQYLRCLVIDGFSAYPKRFAKLLSQVPHLKTLTLGGFYLKVPEGEAFDCTTCVLPPLPQLTHLRLTHLLSTVASHLEISFILWILERYSDQLEGLAVEGNILPSEDKEKNQFEDLKMDKKIGKLKHLKISPMDKFILQLIRAPALTHIMVTGVNYGHLVKMEELLGLISNFSKSLVYLRIKVLVTNFEKKRKSKAKFTALKKLSITFPSNENEVSIMKTHILPRFTVLEKLEFLFRGNFKPEIVSAIEKAEYWRVCPLLQEISADCDGVDILANCENDPTNQVVWRAATESS